MSALYRRLPSPDCFSSVGMTPKRGRLGHSVPTPVSLAREPRAEAENASDEFDSECDPLTMSIGRARWKDTTRPQTPLDKMLSRHDCVPPLETLAELSEHDYSPFSSYFNQFSADRTAQNGVDHFGHFTGEEMLSVSYGRSGVTSPTPGDQLSGSFVRAFSSSMDTSLNVPFMQTMMDSSNVFPTASRAPNKALVTISAKTSLILVANEYACEIFGYSQAELVGMKVQALFTEPYQPRQRALVEQHIDSTGETVLLSGKVMDALHSDGIDFPVSVWMKKVKTDDEPRVIVVIEPVARTTAHLSLDPVLREVLFCDENFLTLFGCSGEEDIVGKKVEEFFPSLCVPDASDSQLVGSYVEQQITGQTRTGNVFPVTVRFTGRGTVQTAEGSRGAMDQEEHGRDILYVRVTVYAMLSGMLSFLQEGRVHGCNEHFSLMMFGYTLEEMKTKDITDLFPELLTSLTQVDDYALPLPPLDLEGEGPSLLNQSTGLATTQDSCVFHTVSELSLNEGSLQRLLNREARGVAQCPEDRTEEGDTEDTDPLSQHTDDTANTSAQELGVPSHEPAPLQPTSGHQPLRENGTHVSSSVQFGAELSSTTPQVGGGSPSATEQQHSVLQDSVDHERRLSSTPVDAEREVSPLCCDAEEMHSRHPKVESTPYSNAGVRPIDNSRSDMTLASLPEGFYSGSALHKDGSLLSVWFQLRKISLSGGQPLYCMWVSKDYEEELSQAMDLNLSRNTPKDLRYSQAISPDVTPPVCGPRTQQGHGAASEVATAGDGEYCKAYETVRQIGEGAFGFVAFSRRREDGLMVVVKFLRKVSILPDGWVEDEEMGVVPREIALLARITHPHIVELLEAYENRYYFQMVMSKHGDGMDLFSFIDSCQFLTEPLTSYMFRQVVSALDYLHQRSILHRDIKDENIILDQSFHLKLIDFGSAAYMEQGKLFSTFCGTLEYCSPEVLLGNRYAGPQLEMWALGVTLYTLVYGENPFHDVEETIAGRLHPPFLASPGLMKVLLWLLHPDLKSRATLADLLTDKWVNQPVNIEDYPFELVMTGVAGSSEPTGGATQPDGVLPCKPQQRSASVGV